MRVIKTADVPKYVKGLPDMEKTLAAKRQAAAPPPPDPQALAHDLATRQIEALQQMTETLRPMQEQVTTLCREVVALKRQPVPRPPPAAWRFDVSRDEHGFINHIIANKQ